MVTTKTERRDHRWRDYVLLFGAVFFVFLANRRELGNGDTEPTEFLTVALARGDGPFLDRFHRYFEDGAESERSVAWKRGRLVSLYPLAPAVLALPFVMPQIWALDLMRPGWDAATREEMRLRCRMIGKRSAAAIVALTVVALWHLLVSLGAGAAALPAALTVGFGSDLWVVASQSLWQHGPAALCLTTAAVLLVPSDVSRTRLVFAGLTTALLVACRSTDIFFALALSGYAVWRYHMGSIWFFLFPALLAPLLCAWNLWLFAAVEGGQAELERISMRDKEFQGPHPLAASFVDGASGTLFSPARGLFVFCPWIVLTLAAVPAWLPAVRRQPLIGWLLLALLPYFVLFSKYFCWWAGWTFGPRYWADAMPVFALPLAFTLEVAARKCRVLLAPLGAAIVLAVILQAIGALCYPSSWNKSPTNVDRDTARLWDWRDTEILRCLSEGVRKPEPLVLAPWDVQKPE